MSTVIVAPFHSDRRQWCIDNLEPKKWFENLGGRAGENWSINTCHWYFENDEDATLFALRWGGKE